MKRILFSLLFALLALSASAQSDSIRVVRRAPYRGDIAASAFVVPMAGGSYAFETTHGVALGRRDLGFVGAGLKYTCYDFGQHSDGGSSSNTSLRVYIGYVRGKYIVPSKKMKVNFFVLGDLGLGFWKSYNLETLTANHCAGVYANGDLGMAIKLYKQLSLDISVGMWGVLGECGLPHLKLGFTF
jgi:hypothetical protein